MLCDEECKNHISVKLWVALLKCSPDCLLRMGVLKEQHSQYSVARCMPGN